MLYLYPCTRRTPDLTLHDSGVENEKVDDQIKLLDDFVGTIFDSVVQHRKLRDNVNVIFIGKFGTEYVYFSLLYTLLVLVSRFLLHFMFSH